MVTWASSPTTTLRAGAPCRPSSSTCQPARAMTAWRPAAMPVKFAIWPPVTKPTPAEGGRPNRSSSQAAATSSTTAAAGPQA